MTWLRALIVAVASVIFPGAGHALLRDWVRALLFAGLFVSAVAVFVPVAEVDSGGSPFEASQTLVQELPTSSRLVLAMMVLFAAVDAVLRATGLQPGTGGGSDEPTCPHCGKDLDEDLEFCHWCTTRLETAEDVAAGE